MSTWRKPGGVNRRIAWHTSPCTWPRSVRWRLAGGWLVEISAELRGSGSALETCLWWCAIQMAAFTLIYYLQTDNRSSTGTFTWRFLAPDTPSLRWQHTVGYWQGSHSKMRTDEVNFCIVLQRKIHRSRLWEIQCRDITEEQLHRRITANYNRHLFAGRGKSRAEEHLVAL